ncbi:MAG TPA: Uma2 family endonuclease [Burkholderiaceae bacterium]
MQTRSIEPTSLAERLAALPRRMTVDDYHRLGETGVLLEHDRVELIDGELVAMSPIGSGHGSFVTRLTGFLWRAVGEYALVWATNPVVLSELSEPQPDVALLKPRADWYAGSLPRPADVLLLIEVADSSLRFDRAVKMPLYARHGIAEYWLLDVARRRISVFSDPGDRGYRREVELGEGTLRPALLPQVEVRLEELFR